MEPGGVLDHGGKIVRFERGEADLRCVPQSLLEFTTVQTCQEVVQLGKNVGAT